MVSIPVGFDQKNCALDYLIKFPLRCTADKLPAAAKQFTYRDNVITTQIFVIFSETSNL